MKVDVLSIALHISDRHLIWVNLRVISIHVHVCSVERRAHTIFHLGKIWGLRLLSLRLHCSFNSVSILNVWLIFQLLRRATQALTQPETVHGQMLCDAGFLTDELDGFKVLVDTICNRICSANAKMALLAFSIGLHLTLLLLFSSCLADDGGYGTLGLF